MATFTLTAEQEDIYRNYRSVDLVLEREYRKVFNSPAVDNIIIDLQIALANQCETALIKAGVNPNEPENGLRNWIACAFAEYCEMYLAFEQGLAA